MAAEDIRWMQRFDHFKSALNQLNKFVEKGELSELEQLVERSVNNIVVM